jgi:hypothetical protein
MQKQSRCPPETGERLGGTIRGVLCVKGYPALDSSFFCTLRVPRRKDIPAAHLRRPRGRSVSREQQITGKRQLRCWAEAGEARDP